MGDICRTTLVSLFEQLISFKLSDRWHSPRKHNSYTWAKSEAWPTRSVHLAVEHEHQNIKCEFHSVFTTTGVHYAIITQTNSKVNIKPKSRMFIQMIGDKCETDFIPLQYSQTNKCPFSNGKRDVFDLICQDVGQVGFRLHRVPWTRRI